MEAGSGVWCDDGESWPQFLAQCRTRQGAPAGPSSTAAPAPGAPSGSLFPWSQPSAPASASASNVARGLGRPKRHEDMRKPMERRQGGGNHRRPDAGRSFCAVPHPSGLGRRLALRRFRSRAGRPRPPPSPAPRSPGGNRPLRLRRQRRTPARLRRWRLANTRPNWRPAPDARLARSYGPIRRAISTTTREPVIMAGPTAAAICVKLMRARLGIVRRGAGEDAAETHPG